MTEAAPRIRDAGVTLIEVIVALALLSAISAAGLAMLQTVLRVNERTEGRIERLSQIDRTFLVIRRDLSQVSAGAVELSDGTLAFSRTSADGVIAQRFVFEDGLLLREVPAANGEVVAQRLLAGLDTARWQLLDADRQWQEVWPPATADTPAPPVAAELTLQMSPNGATGLRGDIVRLFALPEAARQ